MIKTWQQRCEENHEGIVSEGMIQARMQEEIDELRQAEGCAECGKQASKGWALYCVACKWVGLTDEEKEYFKKLGMVGVEIIESKLKERNS